MPLHLEYKPRSCRVSHIVFANSVRFSGGSPGNKLPQQRININDCVAVTEPTPML